MSEIKYYNNVVKWTYAVFCQGYYIELKNEGYFWFKCKNIKCSKLDGKLGGYCYAFVYKYLNHKKFGGK